MSAASEATNASEQSANDLKAEGTKPEAQSVNASTGAAAGAPKDEALVDAVDKKPAKPLCECPGAPFKPKGKGVAALNKALEFWSVDAKENALGVQRYSAVTIKATSVHFHSTSDVKVTGHDGKVFTVVEVFTKKHKSSSSVKYEAKVVCRCGSEELEIDITKVAECVNLTTVALEQLAAWANEREQREQSALLAAETEAKLKQETQRSSLSQQASREKEREDKQRGEKLARDLKKLEEKQWKLKENAAKQRNERKKIAAEREALRKERLELEAAKEAQVQAAESEENVDSAAEEENGESDTKARVRKAKRDSLTEAYQEDEALREAKRLSKAVSHRQDLRLAVAAENTDSPEALHKNQQRDSGYLLFAMEAQRQAHERELERQQDEHEQELARMRQAKQREREQKEQERARKMSFYQGLLLGQSGSGLSQFPYGFPF